MTPNELAVRIFICVMTFLALISFFTRENK